MLSSTRRTLSEITPYHFLGSIKNECSTPHVQCNFPIKDSGLESSLTTCIFVIGKKDDTKYLPIISDKKRTTLLDDLLLLLPRLKIAKKTTQASS
jgi:hypothetical protein